MDLQEERGPKSVFHENILKDMGHFMRLGDER